MMNKKGLLAISILLLFASVSYAQVSREPISSEGKTAFTNIAVVGLNKDGDFSDGVVNTGTPGYVEMMSSSGKTYYLYIDSKGDLRIASDTSVGFGASPATVGWSDASGTVVGTQSGIGL